MAEGDNSGCSVSLTSDGSRVAVGACSNDGTGADAGHVQVYEWAGGRWDTMGNDIDAEAAGDASGGSLMLSADGTRLAVGARGNDGGRAVG